MSFAKNLKFVAVAAALVLSGASVAVAADEAKVSASLSPSAQMDWDAAHRDANAYAASNKARTDERLLVKSDRADEAQNADVKHVAQSQTKAAAPQPAK